jgi:hypothetical protein
MRLSHKSFGGASRQRIFLRVPFSLILLRKINENGTLRKFCSAAKGQPEAFYTTPNTYYTIPVLMSQAFKKFYRNPVVLMASCNVVAICTLYNI